MSATAEEIAKSESQVQLSCCLGTRSFATLLTVYCEDLSSSSSCRCFAYAFKLAGYLWPCLPAQAV